MHTLFVIIHVASMVTSLGFMATALLMGFFGKKAAATIATFGAVMTASGGISGVFLLLSAPLSMECALLTIYLITMSALYIFGFNMGYAENARFIRNSSLVEKK
jgi:hypothetical protein